MEQWQRSLMCSHFAPRLRVLPKRKKGNIVDSDWNSALKTRSVSLFCCEWRGLDQWCNYCVLKENTLVENIEWIVYINPTFWSFFGFSLTSKKICYQYFQAIKYTTDSAKERRLVCLLALNSPLICRTSVYKRRALPWILLFTQIWSKTRGWG